MGNSCSYEYTDVSTSSLESAWHCPHDALDAHKRCVFHLSPTERDEADISEDLVHERFFAALASGDSDRRAFIGGSLPGLDFRHTDVTHEDQRSLDLRHVTIDGDVRANFARFEEALDLRDATLGAFRAENADFNNGLICERATFEGPVDCTEGIFTGDEAVFTAATFGGAVRFNEASFADASTFDEATFSEEATFLGTEFHGRSSEIDDSTGFNDATFEGAARFEYAQFEAGSFERTRFEQVASFEDATAAGAVTFEDATFKAEADFDGTRFQDDVSLAGAAFEAEARFQGAEFDGGATILRDDADFSDVRFGAEVTFESGRFAVATFEDVTFAADACFQDVDFREDASFAGARFAADAVFDEATFEDDASFEDLTFSALASFRGVEFCGATNHSTASLTVASATFEGDANFRDVSCTTASFRGVRFAGDVCFAQSAFRKRIDLEVASMESNTVANFTDAHLAAGDIVQPKNGWVRYDFTRATLGEVVFAVAGTEDWALFDYVRFCDTSFDGFDFTAHVEYFARSDWVLHGFDDDGLEYEYAVEMTPLAIEKTYQRAKISASEEGNVDASGKFRYKRQQFARKNYLAVARDASEPFLMRVRNALRVAENLFLGVSCGHGMRLYRITTMFVLFPILPGLLFAFGGPGFLTESGQLESLADLATPGGVATLFDALHFSYISFLTIGYGDVVATGGLARIVVAVEAYVSVILGGLFIYVLVKRSEL